MGASSAVSNVSEVGIVSYSLQKLLIFFMILDAAWMVLGYSFLGPLLSFLFHFMVLQGVKRGRTSILMIYVVLNVIVLSLAAIGTLFALGAVLTYSPNDMEGMSSSSEYSTAQQTPSYGAMINSYITTTIAPTPQIDIASASASASSSSYENSAEIEADNMLLAGSIFLVISVIVLYCKIYSVVLAARLRRLLLASPVLPVHVTLPVGGVQDHSESDEKPLLQEEQQYVPTTYEDMNPMFAQPGFVPMMQPQLYYPNMQGAPSMMPPPFMYGQHPVFYTFAPAPPTNEKQ